jgi:prolyl-tRNA synthetase
MVIKPYAGYAIWGKMQAELDRMSKETDIVMPIFLLFVPKMHLKPKRKCRRFYKECASVTHYRLKMILTNQVN